MSKPGFPIHMDQTITVQNHYRRNSDGSIFNGTDSCFIRGHFEDKDGSNSPNWPVSYSDNPYLRSVFLWSQDNLTVDGTVLSNGDTFWGDWGDTFGLGYNPIPDSYFSMTEANDVVVSKLTNKLISAIQSHRVNLGEILETRAQCASMVASTANRIAGAVLAARRGNFRGASQQLLGTSSLSSSVKRNFGGVPEWWLAHQYGWKPLLQDVYNSCETVRRAWGEQGELFTVKASASHELPEKVRKARPFAHGPEISWSAHERRAKGNAALVYGVDSQLASSLSQLGITNPLSLAWELLPYSFVVDWFIPIGTFLENLDYARGLVFKRGYMSVKLKQRFSSRLTDSHSADPGYSATWTGGVGSGSAMVFTRAALSSWPYPPTPRFKDPFSLTHVANALSLLSQAFNR
jgi:hypothetical protein